MARSSSCRRWLPAAAGALLVSAAGGASPAPGPRTSAPRGAFFIVQGADLRGDSAAALAGYAVLVANAGLAPPRVKAAAHRNALVLGYLNPHQVPLWGDDSPFFRRYRAAMDDDRLYWQCDGGARASIYPNTEELLPRPETARRLAEFVASEYGGWDGIFLDELWGELPAWALRRLPGVAATDWPRIRAEWDAYRDRFVKELRARYDGLLVANVGRRPERVRHLRLDGITIENELVTGPADSLRFVRELRRYPAARCITWDWSVDAGIAVAGRTERDGGGVPDPTGTAP